MVKIALIGDIYTDIQTGPLKTLPVWNGDLKADKIEILLGGSACNTARYLGGLGLVPRLFTALGSDMFSEGHLKRLREEKYVEVEKSVVCIENTSAPTAVVIYGPIHRTFISNNGSLDRFSTEFIDRDLLFKSDHIHIGGYFVCLALHTNEFITLLRTAKKHKITISMDCQFDSTLKWTGKNNHLQKLLPLIDIFMPSEFEAYGISKEKTVRASFSKIALSMPNGIIIIKNGEQGVYFKLPSNNEIHNVPAFETYHLVDTTGAGDSFNAGFLYKLLSKDINRKERFSFDSVRESAVFGCAVAKFCIEKVGAFNRIDLNDVERILAEKMISKKN